MTYRIACETLRDVWDEFEPLMREHYAETAARIEGDGGRVSPFKPRKDAYFRAQDQNGLLFFTVRQDGAPVGHAAIYLTNDMHNGDYIATEDMLFITKAHRNGLGRKLTKAIMGVLQSMGVKRAHITTATDNRASKLFKRLGAKHTAECMTYYFKET